MAAVTPPEPVQCARPGCQVRFVSKSSRRLYCSTRCSRTMQRYKLALQGGNR